MIVLAAPQCLVVFVMVMGREIFAFCLKVQREISASSPRPPGTKSLQPAAARYYFLEVLRLYCNVNVLVMIQK